MKPKSTPVSITLISLLLSGSVAYAQAPQSLEEVVVNSDFRPSELHNTAASLTVMTAEIIRSRSAQHIEELINIAPNVNFASGSSRARYFQIRGIGERSQFSQPINPSVGFLIDEIDFSGIATAATLFDVEQVDVLRGPQGTRYGANAMAGLINVRTKAPSEELEAAAELSIAEYDSYSVGGSVSGPLVESTLLGRLSVQSYESDGFIDNTFLNTDDTNNRDEQTTRAKLRWLAGEQLMVDLAYTRIDVDNGYDAFSLDNDRNTRSDEPGHDRQLSDALIVDIDWQLNDAIRVEALTSYVETEMEYGYDEDWTYLGFHPWEYSSTDNYVRDRDNYSVEVRFLSDDSGKLFNGTTDWVVGVYQAEKEEELLREYTYLTADYSSVYETENTAIYGQLDTALTDRLSLTTGLRFEQWQADYRDSEALTVATDEDLWGGKVGLDYQYSDQHLLYASLSRGYKAGGVNTDGTLPDAQRSFDTEYLWSLEGGIKSLLLDNSLRAQLSWFYIQRKDQQVKGSFTIARGDGSTEFIDYVDNAAEGDNYGLEAELDWQVNTQWQVFANVGLLNTEIDDYITPNGEDNSGRDQAHAPGYQFALGGEYQFTGGWYFRAELEGKDKFYFSDRHDEESSNYELLNARVGYRANNWSVALWGRNLSDEDYEVRGFGFANDPRDGYSTGGYSQLGEPRIVGVSVNWNL